ncbi:MAG: tetratricopeptide repeat protein [Planctomycetes bacterium]|nr:tetratricopeptide repeat protein [Planctomycetota bacterium]
MPATIDSVDALLIELTRRGIELQAHGDRLRFRPRSAMTPELVEAVKVHKFALLTVFVGHSAFIRYHEFSGLKQALALDHGLDDERRTALAQSAHAHLGLADRWGLVRNLRVERSLLTTSLHLDRAEDVDRYAQRLLARNPYDASVRLRLGQSYASQEHDDKARRELSAIVAQPRAAGPQVAPATLAAAYHALGELSARQGHFDAAATELQDAVGVEPDRATAHAALGSALAELGRIDAAIASLNRAVQLDPTLGQAHFNLGTLHAHRERFEQAIPCYERALAIDPDDADLRNNFGLALLRSGQLDRAREHLERAIELNPQNADAHFNLGVLLASRSRSEEASKHFATAVRLDPRYGRLLEGGPPG